MRPRCSGNRADDVIVVEPVQSRLARAGSPELRLVAEPESTVPRADAEQAGATLNLPPREALDQAPHSTIGNPRH